MKIPVYILSTSNPSRKEELHRFFSKNKLFKVVDWSCDTGAVGINYIDTENNLVIAALEDAKRRFPKDYVLIVKDSSTTASTPNKVAKIIKKAISLNKNSKCSCNSNSYNSNSYSSNSYSSNSYSSNSSNSYSSSYNSTDNHNKCDCAWDLFYLCKWLDRCDLYKKCTEKKGINLVKTYSPLGIQALMFSPRGRDMTLGCIPLRPIKDDDCHQDCEYFTPITLPLDEQLAFVIEDGQMKAIAATPNIFEFDITLAKLNTDLLKMAECRLEIEEVEDDEVLPGALPLIWFIIIFVGIILLAWIFYQGIAKYEVIDTSKDISRVQRA